MSQLEMPTWDQVRDRMNEAVTERGEWAGAPLPIDGFPLVIEPKYPYAGLQGMSFGEQAKEPEEPVDYTVRNSWFCKKHGLTVVLMQEADGRVTKCFLPGSDHNQRATMALNTLGVAASPAWSITAETNAMEKLHALVGQHKFKLYFMTGSFTETSKRSGVTYMFRRLRPTLAIRAVEDNSRILAALCLHPIGYYDRTWGGVMVPTDCVVAHLLLMRSDERRYWSQANQHHPGAPEAGI
jgi:hypothetical protein